MRSDSHGRLSQICSGGGGGLKGPSGGLLICFLLLIMVPAGVSQFLLSRGTRRLKVLVSQEYQGEALVGETPSWFDRECSDAIPRSRLQKRLGALPVASPGSYVSRSLPIPLCACALRAVNTA